MKPVGNGRLRKAMEYYPRIIEALVIAGIIWLIVRSVKKRKSRKEAEEAAPKLQYSTSFKTPDEPKPLEEASETPHTAEPIGADTFWTCSFCGSKNPQTARACPRCGGERGQENPVYAQQETEPKWVCQLCGAKNPLSKKYCPSCGTIRE